MTVRLFCSKCNAAFPCKVHHALGVDTNTRSGVRWNTSTTEGANMAAKSRAYQNLTNDPKFDKLSPKQKARQLAALAKKATKRG